jgi:hypothetical protein
MKVNGARTIIASFLKGFAASKHKQFDEGLFDWTQRSEGEQDKY